MGMQTPREYGGLDLDTTSYARIMEELASYDNSVAVFVGGHQSIGMKALLLFGTEEQKTKYLPKLARDGPKARPTGQGLQGSNRRDGRDLGAEKAQMEVRLCRAVCRNARHTASQLLKACDANDNEIRTIANFTYESDGYFCRLH